LDGFVVAVKKLPPPVTKAGIKEFLLELIVDADLVCFLIFTFFLSFDVSLYQSFRFVERASFRRLVCYLCPKPTETDIPKRTCIGDSIQEKVERLDDIDVKIIDVSASSHFYSSYLSIISFFNF
jgi:hypothetical protein